MSEIASVPIEQWRKARGNGELVKAVAGKWWTLHAPADLTEEEWIVQFKALGSAAILRNLATDEIERQERNESTPDGQGSMFDVGRGIDH